MTQEQNDEMEKIVDATIEVNLMIARFVMKATKQFQNSTPEQQEEALAEINVENARKDKETIQQLKELKVGLYSMIE